MDHEGSLFRFECPINDFPEGFASQKEGNVIKLTSFGARIIWIEVPDKAGYKENITFGYDTFKEIINCDPNYGAVVGRYANRIARGRFIIDGTHYKLSLNNGPMKAEFQRRIDEFRVHFINRNETGGRAYFLPGYSPEMSQAILKEAIPVWDVTIEEPVWPVKIGPACDGSFTYNHKVKDNRHIYFFANSSDKTVDSYMTLRGSVDVSVWDPMNGEIRSIEESYTKSKDGQ